jgi:hypothetical protein
MQFQNGVSIFSNSSGLGGLGNNVYSNPGTADYYIATGFATRYYQFNGTHVWNTAASGNAGDTISFTQAMTLDASGNWMTGTTTAIGRATVVGGSSQLAFHDGNGSNTNYGLLNYGGSSGELTLNANSTGGNTLIRFLTSSGGSNAERARITSGGDLLLGTTSATPANANGVIAFGGTDAGIIYLQRQTGTDQLRFYTGGNRLGYVNTASSILTLGTANFPLVFATNDTERARITSGGDLLVGMTNTTPSNALGFAVNNSNAGISYTQIQHASGTASGASYEVFYYNASPIGSITQNGTTAVAYNTSSDYRLKDNPQPLTNSGAFIDALKPKTWNWKADGSKGVGFIAHEVQEVSPGSVVGEKDGEQMQAMEYGSAEFIANIIAEIQSLRARVAQLEAK